MDANPDFRDLLLSLSDAGARFLVVGAYAVIYHSEPRYTKDLDIWVDSSPANADRVWKALATFGAPVSEVPPSRFTDEDFIFQIGVEPNRIDVLTAVLGLEFAAAWEHRVASTYAGVPIHILGKDDLIRAKKAAGRHRDLGDVATLEGREPPRTRRKSQSRRRSR